MTAGGGCSELEKRLKNRRATRASRFDVNDDSCERTDILWRTIDRFDRNHGMRPVCIRSRQTISGNGVIFGASSAIKTRVPLLYSPAGEVAEWLKAPLSKSGVRQRTAGSNPALSATHSRSRPGAGQDFDLTWCPGTHAERCESGLIGTPGKRVYRQRYRGFESRPLRHTGISSNEVMSRLLAYSRDETRAAA